jgi:hypothetical protein
LVLAIFVITPIAITPFMGYDREWITGNSGISGCAEDYPAELENSRISGSA